MTTADLASDPAYQNLLAELDRLRGLLGDKITIYEPFRHRSPIEWRCAISAAGQSSHPCLGEIYAYEHRSFARLSIGHTGNFRNISTERFGQILLLFLVE